MTQCPPAAECLQLATPSILPGVARNPAESPMWQFSLSSKTRAADCFQKVLALLGGKPISNRDAQPLGALHAANSSSQIRGEEASIGRLIRQPPNCSETQVQGG
jgi:hypothetical protein